MTQRSQHPGGHGRGQGIYPLKVSCCTPAKKSRCRPRRDRRGPPTPKLRPAALRPYVPLRGGARLPTPTAHRCISPSRGTCREHPRCRGGGLHGKPLGSQAGFCVWGGIGWSGTPTPSPSTHQSLTCIPVGLAGEVRAPSLRRRPGPLTTIWCSHPEFPPPHRCPSRSPAARGESAGWPRRQ